MTWVRIDDGAPLHPKLLAVGPEAAWLWIAGLAYANRHVTDGVIPPHALPALYPTEGWSRRRLLELAGRLVDAALWVARAEGGWSIHAYAEFQREAMREAVVERRRWEAERKARQRAAARKRTRNDLADDGESRPIEEMSQWDRGGTGVGHVPGTPGGTSAGTARGTPTEQPVAAPRPAMSQAPGPARPDPDVQKPERAGDGASAPPPARAPKAPRTKDDREEAPPIDPTARAVFEAIVADPLLSPVTRRPADLAVRLTAPEAFPGVNVLGQVLRAAAWNAGQRLPKRDGRAFLLGWLGRADREPPAPLLGPVGASGGRSFARPVLAPPPSARDALARRDALLRVPAPEVTRAG